MAGWNGMAQLCRTPHSISDRPPDPGLETLVMNREGRFRGGWAFGGRPVAVSMAASRVHVVVAGCHAWRRWKNERAGLVVVENSVHLSGSPSLPSEG
jgi:hypothetical protein